MNKLCFFFVVSAAVCGHAAINTINDTNLVCDITIDVPAGTTTDVARVSGGAYTITKTGGGMLRFGWVRNGDAKLVVREGAVDFSLRRNPRASPKRHFST